MKEAEVSFNKIRITVALAIFVLIEGFAGFKMREDLSKEDTS